MIDGNKKIEQMSIADLLKLVKSGKLTSMQVDYVNSILNQKRNDAYAEFFSLDTDDERRDYVLKNSMGLGKIMSQSFEMFLSKDFQDWKKSVDKMRFDELVSEKARLEREVKSGNASQSMLDYVKEAIAWVSSSGAVDKDKAGSSTGLKGDFSNLERHTDMYQGTERLG